MEEMKMRHLTKKLLSGFLALAMLYSCLGTAFAGGNISHYASGRATGSAINQGQVTEGRINVVLPTVAVDFYNLILDPTGAVVANGAAGYPGVVDYDEGKLYFKNQNVDAAGGIALYHNSDPLTVINKGTVPVNVRLSVLVDPGGYDFSFSDTPDFQDPGAGLAMYLAAVSGRRWEPVTTVDSGGTPVSAAVLDSWIGAVEGLHDIEWEPGRQIYRYVPKADAPDSAFQSFSFFMTGAITEGEWTESGAPIALTPFWEVTESEDEAFPYPDPDVAPSVKEKTRVSAPGANVVLLADMGCGSESYTMDAINSVTYQKADGSSATISADALTIEDLDANTTRITYSTPAAYTRRVTFAAPEDVISASEWKLHVSNSSGAKAEAEFDPVGPDPVVWVVQQATLAGDTVSIDVHYGSGDTAFPYAARIDYTTKDGESAAYDVLTRGNNAVSFAPNRAFLEGSGWKLVLAKEDAEGAEEIPFDVDIYKPAQTQREPTVRVSAKASATGDTVSLSFNYGAGLGYYPNVDKAVFDLPAAEGEESTEGEIPASAMTVSGTKVTFKATEAFINGANWKIQLSNAAGDTCQLDIDACKLPTPTPTPTPEPTLPPGVTATSTPTPRATHTPTPTIENREVEIVVTKKAAASGDTAEITVDWGAGEPQMTSVAELKYTTYDNRAASISSETYLTVKEHVITVLFNASTIKGHDFVVVLRNAYGELKEYPVDLLEAYTPTIPPTPSPTPSPEASPTPTPKPTFTPTPTIENRDPVITVVKTAAASGEMAEMTVDWGSGAGQMTSVVKMSYINSKGTATSTNSATYLQTKGNTVTFKFTASTLKANNFRLVLRNASGQTYTSEVLYLITGSAPVATPTNTPTPTPRSATPTPKPTNTPTPTPLNAPAAVTVVRKAASAGEIAEMEVYWGSGDQARTSVVEVQYTTSANKQASISSATYLNVSGNTVTLLLSASSIKGRDFKLILRNANGGTEAYPVDILESYYEPEEAELQGESTPTPTSTPTNTPTPTMANRPASVRVVTKAAAANDTAEIYVDWGSGVNAKTSVVEVQYTTATNTSASVSSSTYLGVSGNTVTLKFNTSLIKGRDFKLILRNASGATEAYPIDVLESYYVPPTATPTPKATNTPTPTPTPAVVNKSPTVTVTKKASASGDSAEMTIDWGSGNLQMTSVANMTYTNSKGTETSTSSTTYLKVSGNNVTFKFTASTIKATNFKLVLRNASGATVAIPVTLIG